MSETTQLDPTSLEAVYVKMLRDKVATVADELRRMADRIESATADTFDRGRPVASYAQAAERVQHEILWGVANLSLPSLASHAAATDLARAEEAAKRS